MAISERYKRVSDTAAILREVYGPNAAKKIARRFGVAIVTAKVWLAGRFPENRTQELASIVREELDRIDARNKEIRMQLGLTNGGWNMETSSKTGSGAPLHAAVVVRTAPTRVRGGGR